MGTYVACYDLEETSPDIHLRFLEFAIDEGWFPIGLRSSHDAITSHPNTALEVNADKLSAAVDKFRSIASLTADIGYTVRLKRVAIFEVVNDIYWKEENFEF